MDNFKKGYEFFVQSTVSYNGYTIGDKYISDIKAEIDILTNDINNFKGYQTSTAQLKGDIAEYWHADTFNINAVINDSKNRAMVDRSHDFSSVDVSTNFTEKYGLKYYANAKASAKAQAKGLFESYKEYKSRGGKLELEEYIKERGYSDLSDLNDPIYYGQHRLIPKDQLEEAATYLKRKILEEESKRPELVKRYQDTLDMITDRIKDSEGTESIPLSKSESEQIASLAKEDKFNPEEYNITTEELVKFSNIINKSFKAGLSSAIIAVILQSAPTIIEAVEYLVECGEIDKDQLKEIGFDAIKTAPISFIQGATAAAIITSCESGLAGTALNGLNPTIISTATIILFNSMKNAYNVITGDMTRNEMTSDLIRDMFVSSISLGFGLTSQLLNIPLIGFMLGSFVGSVIGSFVYKAAYHPVISFCIDSGFTMFGLVEQNYTLSEDIIREIGIEVFDYEKYDYEHFEPERFEYKRFDTERFEPTVIEMTFLRRGVIGVSAVGYMS